MFIDHFDFTVPLLFTIPELLSPEECQKLIQDHEPGTWLPATINAQGGRVVDEKIRDNTTAIVRNGPLAEDLFLRLVPHLPSSMMDGMRTPKTRVKPLCLFQPLRIYRYENGQHFGMHHDQSYQDAQGNRSLFTFLVYLNHGFVGGSTVFPEQKERIEPKTGTALLFQHMLLHAGEAVQQGIKYVLRSDVVFGP